MSLKIPLSPHPNQRFDVNINNQYCIITLEQRSTGLFFGMTVNGVACCDNVLCLDRQPVIFTDYRGFVGNLYFQDMQGTSDPEWSGLGSRYWLIYE
jgi:hypothetical protein